MLSRIGMRKTILGIVGLLVIAGGIWWWHAGRSAQLVYIPDGCGGYAPAPRKSKKTAENPLESAVSAYNAGKYEEAETEAVKVRKAALKSDDPADRRVAAEAQSLSAFSAAFRNDMKTARERFSVLREEAAKLPAEEAKSPSKAATYTAPLEEQAAYQHAVCTAALGEKEAAEAEFIKFMLDYPESMLMNGVVQRLTRLNGGKSVNSPQTPRFRLERCEAA